MGEGSFHWDSSYLSWHSYTSITGLGSEVRWETPAGQVGVLSWARGSKSRGQERASCELAWGEILHFLSFWHCDFLMADWSFTDFLFCGTTSCSLCFGKQVSGSSQREAVAWTLFRWLSAQKPGAVVWSQRRKPAIRACEWHSAVPPKALGMPRSCRSWSQIFVLYLLKENVTLEGRELGTSQVLQFFHYLLVSRYYQNSKSV